MGTSVGRSAGEGGKAGAPGSGRGRHRGSTSPPSRGRRDRVSSSGSSSLGSTPSSSSSASTISQSISHWRSRSSKTEHVALRRHSVYRQQTQTLTHAHTLSPGSCAHASTITLNPGKRFLLRRSRPEPPSRRTRVPRGTATFALVRRRAWPCGMFVGQNTVRATRRLACHRPASYYYYTTHIIYIFLYLCSVLAQVDAKMVRPEPQRPFEGLITVHCELSPMASTEYEPGRYVLHIQHQHLFPR